MPTAYLFCPAYPLHDEAQMRLAVAIATRFADLIAHELVVSPDIGRWGAVGAWHEARHRRADFTRALAHDVLIPVRGGYGCSDLVDIALAHTHRLPLLLGYSDLTVLHACWRRRACASHYGFMPAATPGPRSLESTTASVRGDAMRWDGHTAVGAVPLHPGSARGPLFGACLRVLASLCGTTAMPDLTGCILALEDIDERPYQIDRDLTQLERSGALSGVAGLIFGSFPAPKRPGYAGPDAQAVCRSWSERLRIPCVQAFPFGHDDDPITLPCGRAAILAVASDTWSLDLPAASP